MKTGPKGGGQREFSEIRSGFLHISVLKFCKFACSPVPDQHSVQEHFQGSPTSLRNGKKRLDKGASNVLFMAAIISENSFLQNN